MINYDFLNNLNEKQKKVCIDESNYILTACPGSGKTRTLTYRLAYLSTKYKDSNLLNIAITYTNRAADEIENRLIDMDVNTHTIWSGTIHQFCLKFIIRPYAMYHSKLSKGYKIIDEYVKEKYVKEIAKKLNIKGYFNDLYYNPEIVSEYNTYIDKKKEIDFDKILEYSLELIEQKDYIATNIANLIRSIHIDEFQDTNEKQYLILSKIINANIDINILFFGDVNQSIYGNLGGVAKNSDEIRNLFPVKFKECCLEDCYRSTQRIVEYYKNYEVLPNNAKSVAYIKDEKGVIKYDKNIDIDNLANSISRIVKTELDNGIDENEICIVAPQWYQIFPIANKLKSLLPDCSFDAPDITPIKYDPLNIFFLISKLLFTKQLKNSFIKRKIADEIINIIREDYDFNISENIDKLDILYSVNSTEFIDSDFIQTLKKAIENIFKMLKIEMNDNIKTIYEEFFNKIDERINTYNLGVDCNTIIKSFKERSGIVVSTIHKIKGEEYTTVIAFDLLNGHLPHWNYIMDDDSKPQREKETKKLLYVLCSRAKKNLYLFSEKGRYTKKDFAYLPTDELISYNYNYDNCIEK